MKINKNTLKITLGLFFLSTIIVFANNNDPAKNDKEIETTDIVTVDSPLELNKEYITVVHENVSQEEVEFLSEVVSQWDVRKSQKFEALNKPFTAIFKSNKGFAEVKYDSEGRVIAVEKRLENVVLPSQIQKLVFQRYQDWTVVQNKFKMSYKQGFDVKKTYEITILKDNEKKRIRMNG